uniref:Uncharacterized protein n=1 Tax=Rhizophora mucronata TaxID=61149 RepID=A0A2P2N285_RHIMU
MPDKLQNCSLVTLYPTSMHLQSIIASLIQKDCVLVPKLPL